MNYTIRYLCCAFLLVLHGADAGAADRTPRHTPGQTHGNPLVWLLKQDHVDIGPEEIYLAHDAIKVINLRNGFEIICKAPDWKVHCFSHSQKLEWIAPMNEFDGKCIVNLAASFNATPEQIKTAYVVRKKGKMLGLNYTRFVPGKPSLSYIDGTTDIVLAPQAIQFMNRLYRIPDTGTVPLQVASDRGVTKSLLEPRVTGMSMDLGRDLRGGLLKEMTTKDWTKVSYKTVDFSIPERYKKTKVLSQVIFSHDMKNEFKQLFIEGPGFRGRLRE